jgi:hypothetical protein
MTDINQTAPDVYRISTFVPEIDLADWAPATLALMHGPAFVCDGRGALLGLADVMEESLGAPAHPA